MREVLPGIQMSRQEVVEFNRLLAATEVLIDVLYVRQGLRTKESVIKAIDGSCCGDEPLKQEVLRQLQSVWNGIELEEQR